MTWRGLVLLCSFVQIKIFKHGGGGCCVLKGSLQCWETIQYANCSQLICPLFAKQNGKAEIHSAEDNLFNRA